MNEINSTPATSHAQTLNDAAYLRERMAPRWRDVNYPHLRDLADWLRREAATVSGEVFDFGCGGAPYRPLFAHCKRYVAADIEKNPAVDVVLPGDGTSGQASDSCDVVLSTQVLEHIRDPQAYVRECHRILRARGQLILTTHGMFEEHGCPNDFQRWTARGLEELVTGCGFGKVTSYKLTTEMRAFAQLRNQMVLHFRAPGKPPLHFLLASVRKFYGVIGVPCTNWLADRFPEQAVVPGNHPASLYVCVAVRAEKI
ncbi:MAG: class I SAM-dependent methyltransferase [Pedosphaera sp.]|nr:class I SAM-dependent methyltransferase [Pedosphaera sp.]